MATYQLLSFLPAAFALQMTASTLYDGALGTLPSSQGWFYLVDPIPGSVTQSVTAGATKLDSTAVTGDKAGYFGLGLTPLDRQAGYVVGLEARLTTETHDTPDRAGFSLIVLSSDKLGVEIGFWEGQVWAQNTGFTHGEGAVFDTTQLGVRYELTVKEANYSLSANSQPLFQGPLRDYGPALPYTQANFLFMGDDTTSASASVEIRRLAVAPIQAIPEANPGWLIPLGLLGLGLWRRSY